MNYGKIIDFAKGLFSEHDGTPSIMLILVTLIVAFILGCSIAFALQTYKHSITMDQFDSYLGSAGAFIATSCGPLYLLHKGADVLNRRGSPNKDDGTTGGQ